MTDTTVKYVVIDHNPGPLTVIVQPWAEEVVLSSDSQLLLKSFATGKVCWKWCRAATSFVWVWTGCRAMLVLNGQDLTLPWLLRPSP